MLQKIQQNCNVMYGVFVDRPTNRTSVAQGLFRWVRAQDHSPDALGGPENSSDTVNIPLKTDTSGARR